MISLSEKTVAIFSKNVYNIKEYKILLYDRSFFKMSKIQIFFNEMKNKKVAFIGVGVTNTDLIKLFLKKGIRVTVLDRKDKEKMGKG